MSHCLIKHPQPLANGSPAEVVTEVDTHHVVVAMVPNRMFSARYSSVVSVAAAEEVEPKKGVLSLFRVRQSYVTHASHIADQLVLWT